MSARDFAVLAYRGSVNKQAGFGEPRNLYGQPAVIWDERDWAYFCSAGESNLISWGDEGRKKKDNRPTRIVNMPS